MKSSRSTIPVLLKTALLVPVIASAHHSHNNLDRDKIEVHSGVVSEYRWVMPHVYLKIAAPNPRGEVAEYTIELLHPPGMADRGWSPETFKPGDRITWEGAADRDPNRYFSGLNWAEKEDGIRVGFNPTSAGQAPEVLPSTDFTGLWKRSWSFGGTYSPPRDWPYTAAGRSLVENFDPATNPQVTCDEPGPPRFTILPYPIQITRPDDKTIVLTGELRDEPRVVYLDPDHPPAPPSRLGHSIGRFEGEELVVETTNFAPDPWGTHAGIHSSDRKHLLERYSLSDDGKSLRILITVTDPVYLAEPVVMDYPMDKLADRELVHAPCSLESAALFLTGYGNDPRGDE